MIAVTQVSHFFSREMERPYPNFKIYVQQDGAKSHIKPNDEEWIMTLTELGLQDKIVLFDQPANSPDTNVNDLGFFRAMDAAYQRERPKKQGDIVRLVDKVYWEYPHNLLNRIWLTHMSVMNEIIDHHGDNNFKIPHMGKERLERLGQLPRALVVTKTANQLLGFTSDDSDSNDSSIGQQEAV